MSEVDNFHTSVLLTESLNALNVIPNEWYLDCTFGGGGHTEAILKFGGKVISLEVDEDSLKHVGQKIDLMEKGDFLETKESNLKIFRKNFKDLDQVLGSIELTQVSGILFDLGVSSFMLDNPTRGFSFNKDAPLDMRMDGSLSVTAADLVNGLNEGELNELFFKLGEERFSRRIASSICKYRMNKKIESTLELAEIVRKSKPKMNEKVHSATKVFMALRIAVNDELNNLKIALPKAEKFLKKGGRLVVISFHSLEDRIVKEFINSAESLRSLTDKPIIAAERELSINPRSRSAKMRVAEKI